MESELIPATRWDKKLRYLSDSSSLEALRQSCIERGKLGLEIGIMNQQLIGEKIMAHKEC